jgi:hypothetical protein
MVDVIAPLGIVEPGGAILAPLQPTGLVIGVFGDKVDMTTVS